MLWTEWQIDGKCYRTVVGAGDIGENVHIENLVVDKHAKITHAKEIITPADEPGYIKRNDTL